MRKVFLCSPVVKTMTLQIIKIKTALKSSRVQEAITHLPQLEWNCVYKRETNDISIINGERKQSMEIKINVSHRLCVKAVLKWRQFPLSLIFKWNLYLNNIIAVEENVLNYLEIFCSQSFLLLLIFSVKDVTLISLQVHNFSNTVSVNLLNYIKNTNHNHKMCK